MIIEISRESAVVKIKALLEEKRDRIFTSSVELAVFQKIGLPTDDIDEPQATDSIFGFYLRDDEFQILVSSIEGLGKVQLEFLLDALDENPFIGFSILE